MTFGGPGAYGSREGRIEAARAMQAQELVCTTAWPRIPLGLGIEYGPIDHVLLPARIAAWTKVVDGWPGKRKDPNRLSDHSGLIVEISV